MIQSSCTAWENIGARIFPHFGGVMMIEAEKQIYAGQSEAKVLQKRYVMTTQGTPWSNSRNGQRSASSYQAHKQP
jgi:hypothetical protein